MKLLLRGASGENFKLSFRDFRIDQVLEVVLVVHNPQLVLHRFLSEEGSEGFNLAHWRCPIDNVSLHCRWLVDVRLPSTVVRLLLLQLVLLLHIEGWDADVGSERFLGLRALIMIAKGR